MEILNGMGYNAITLSIAIAALAVGGFGAFYAYRALFPPKRRLTFYALPAAPLLSNRTASSVGVSVTREGQVLDDPHTATVSVENTGRHGVGSSQFDGGRPISLDLVAPIKAILKVSISP
ncbi:hypothetical protein AB0M20_30750, partial [Actinoplanes sp. NPDC051633]|uniref:hypothetical protein n=1 Tax=Actinoplanes sp. NPDC051633 TaxID=3155670 RepID=UPI0034227CE2